MSEQPPASAHGPGRGRDEDDADRPGSPRADRASPASDERPAAEDPAAAAAPDRPRLQPRPLERPAVSDEQEAVFGRPSDVRGSFDRREDAPAPPHGLQQQPPTSEALAEAFGRPPRSGATLQRPPGEQPGTEPAEEPVSWDSPEQEPWRDPACPVALGPPAAQEDTGDGEPAQRGPLLSARDVLFGGRVRPRSLLALGALALVIGLCGALLGTFAGRDGGSLTSPEATLAEVAPGEDRPAGSSSSVAQRIVPAVVSVEVQLGAQGGTGSGVVIDGEGYVLTNNHVVSMAADSPNAELTTVFHDGTRVPAQLVGRDPKTDLAVLKVDVANPTVAQLGNSDRLSVGDEVLAVGSPLGLSGTVTNGIVSSVHRPVRLAGEGTDTNAVIDAIQTDAAINPGNSGGALVDGSGAVVGINSAIRTADSSGGEGGSIGLGFAIPIEDARRIAQEIIRTGHAQHADLGVNAKSVTDGLQDGAQVQNVRNGGPAAAAGIAEGDVITRVGDRPVGSADELVVAVDGHRVGEQVPVTVVRQGRELVFDVTL
ncbi:trypsin-like peptidase domain-containing protein [Salinifilum aidingensis]